jgi:hypothetical protein
MCYIAASIPCQQPFSAVDIHLCGNEPGNVYGRIQRRAPVRDA